VVTTLEKKPTGKAPKRSAEVTRQALPLRPHVVGAVFKRNVVSYFSNPAGYVFITLFVLVSSWVAFCLPVFFANNLANLDSLNRWMPYLLLFFIPAITMSIWAEERRQGTDELLLTLPARDVEVVLGKYLAALGIYTVALVFSLSHVLILCWLGSPDPGVMFATYLGYWLMGAMLIAVGMVASLLSSNATVAFILGGLFAAVPVFANLLGTLAGGRLGRLIEELSVPAQFEDFGTGVIPLSGVLYFVLLAVGMLYLNMVLLGRRHWAGGERSRGRWVHSITRVVALVAALASLDVLVSRAGARWDISAGHLHTLSAESRTLIDRIPPDRPVYIQAYVSPDVPREYVQTKANLTSFLKEYAALGGGKIRLNLVETERYSDDARDAEKRFGIEPRRVVGTEEARQTQQEIYMGVAFTSGLEEVVVPFFDRGLPVEYELTRSIRVVSRAKRKKVGILNTDAKLLGGFDFRSMGQESEWSIVSELKKQYEVTSVNPDEEFPNDIDVLLVAQPSSLAQRQIDTLTAYVRKGKPTLLLVDPAPMRNPQLSPSVPKQPPGGPFGGGPPPEPKGSLRALLDLLGIEWPDNLIVWNPYNPHPQLGIDAPEIVFVGQGSGATNAFNPNQAISSGLQEVVLLFPGLLRSSGSPALKFIPLISTNNLGGTLRWDELIRPGLFGLGQTFNADRAHIRSGETYTLAARVQGPAEPAMAGAEKKDADKAGPASAHPVELNAIVIADLDMISDSFFELRASRPAEFDFLDFDNVTFVLNCVDVLAGDDSFVELRKRRPVHRTLRALEAQTKTFVEQSETEEKIAEEDAKQQREIAQQRLNAEVDKVRNSKDYDERTKAIMLANLQEVENRRLDVSKATIEDQKRQKILTSKGNKERAIRHIENRIRLLAILLPPLPALLLGCLVYGVRISRENRGANPNRLA
jgi:gliding motility-associated transport system permease protein/gliding motility-associatede transport system auxiliary component